MEDAPAISSPQAAKHLEEFDLDSFFDSNPPDLCSLLLLDGDTSPSASHLPIEGGESQVAPSGSAAALPVDDYPFSWSWEGENLMGEEKEKDPFDFYYYPPAVEEEEEEEEEEKEDPLSVLDVLAHDVGSSEEYDGGAAHSTKPVEDHGGDDVTTTTTTITTPEQEESNNAPAEKDATRRDDDSLPVPVPMPVVVDDDDGHKEDDDAAAKKRTRQLRNRNSAMKSRERRKLYLQDLERKSKFLEAECRRLHRLLQCCTAENMALRHCLHKDRLHGVPNARQESAVLFEESLLLGSLFWLVNIVFLFLVPNLVVGLDLGHVAVIERARGLRLQQSQEIVGAKDVGERLTLELSSEAVVGRRRFKAFRRKMKSSPISLIFLPMQNPWVACV